MTLNETLQKIKLALINYWNEFLNHIPGIILAVLIVVLGFLLSNVISSISKKTISIQTKDPLITNFLGKTIKYGFVLLVIIFALKIAGLGYIATGFLTAAGASAVIIGFAFKDIGENFISGVILSFSRPFNVNDTVLIGDVFGKVKTIEFRHSKLKTFDGRDVYIPNSDIIKKPVFNYTEDGYYRTDFTVGIDYNDNIDLAKKVVTKAVVETSGVIDTEEHKCFVTVDSLGISTVNLKVLFWTKTMEYKRGALEVKSDVVKNVKNILIKNGLNMPSNITEFKLYNTQKNIPVLLNK
ncbi:mechanosensitive ion channel family protein [Tenacibaculum sp. ZS6-P6]|uniref:mechanosensitive ion channel family protein n=1 Tax=Tenacibaculum sp. ZS6-P6 TaxID=3447503 RepID=UPI003F954F4C